MLTRVFLAAALLTTAAHADFDRQIPAGNQPDLYVSTASGRIHLYAGSDSEIHIRAHVYAGWNAGGDIQDRIRRISDNPPLQIVGNTIHLGDAPQEDRNLYKNITIDYDIQAPRGVALNLRSGSGDIEVDNLGRFLKADTGSGSIRAHGIAGPAELHSGSGDIEANGSLTGAAHLQSGSGSIRLHLGQQARYTVDASTGSGTIRVTGNREGDRHHLNQAVNGGGPVLEAHTGSGDIEVN